MNKRLGQDDLLSRFPDEILQLILSKLPFDEAVQSSTYAHRWVHLWIGTSNVEFKQKETEDHPGFIKRCRLILERRKAAPIEKLQFGMKKYYQVIQHRNVAEITRDCVGFSLGNTMKEISLDFATNAPGYSEKKGRCSCAEASSHYVMHNIHPMLYYNLNFLNGCPLRILKLKDCMINISDYTNFASLETVWLTRVYPIKGTVGEMVQGLTSACTGLKVFGLEFYLHPLRRSVILRYEHLKITCPELEHLTFKCCHCFENIQLVAPKLKHFEYRGELMPPWYAFLLVNSPALVSTNFMVSRSGVNYPAYSGALASMFIKQFAHVKFMTVTFKDTKDIIMIRNNRSENPAVFSQLKELKIERDVDDVLSLEEVLSFITASPSLERLCISLSDETTQMQNVNGVAWMDDELPVIYGINDKIRQLEIHGFNGSKFHFMFVKFLLEHMKTLVEVTIHGCMASYSVHSSVLRKLMHITPTKLNCKLSYV